MVDNSTEIYDGKKVLPSIFESIIRTLLYFDIFNYPLTKDEILNFLSRRSKMKEVELALETLIEKEYVYQFNEFISVQSKKENVVRRLKGNELANKLLPLANRQAGLIGKFPFVRSVMASGSLSKGYMDSDSDLDFFIVTEPGRLWIARMLLVFYKRLFLGNSHKHFCVNYFVSSDKLEIEEKNLFTATELATVIPLFNPNIYYELLRANCWLSEYYPNFKPRDATRKKEKIGTLKSVLEKSINHFGGNLLDEWCMKLTYKRWVTIYKKQYPDKDFKVAFKSQKHASKNHPKHYQKKFTELLEQKWRDYDQKYNLDSL